MSVRNVRTMQARDFEYEERCVNPVKPESGRTLSVLISKVGGGTVGRAYEGRWLYRVSRIGVDRPLMEGDDVSTGSARTHRQVVELVLDFFADEQKPLR